jgi:hypothetical protein
MGGVAAQERKFASAAAPLSCPNVGEAAAKNRDINQVSDGRSIFFMAYPSKESCCFNGHEKAQEGTKKLKQTVP